MSLFISFEGGEGSGKSTQVELLQGRLEAAGVAVLPIHEPGTTPLGLHIRDLLKRGAQAEEAYSDAAELFLFVAARAELVAEVLVPALEQTDAVIVADRYADSTIAYQGYGRGIGVESVRLVNELATDGVMPDLTFLLDCPSEEGLRRVGSFQLKLPLEREDAGKRPQRDEEGTRFEREPLEFHERVRAGYLKIAEAEPARWCVIDASRPVEEIGDIVWQRVQKLLASWRDAPETPSVTQPTAGTPNDA